MRMVAAVVMSVGLVGGCVVEYGSSVPEAARRVLDEGRVEYDLRGGLTREEVGFVEGRSLMSLEIGRDEGPIDVSVVLPDGRLFETAVTRIVFSTLGPGSENQHPRLMQLDRSYPTVDEAYAVLVAFDGEFGLDTTSRPQLEDWRDTSARKMDEWKANGGTLMRDPQVWETPDSDAEWSFEVEASLDRYSGGVILRFLLQWPPVPVAPLPRG